MANTSPKVCIVSFSDDNYAHLVQEMIRSVRRFPQAQGVDIAIFNNEMSAENVAAIKPHVQHIKDAQWNFDHKFLRRRSTWRKAKTAPPFIPEYFPGYDVYVWIDADAWVQDWSAIELTIDWAKDGSVAIAPEVDRAYEDNSSSLRVRWFLGIPLLATTFIYRNGRASIGRKEARALYFKTVLNSGVWALRGDAPHWAAWERYMRMALDRRYLRGDQIPLNLAIYRDGLPVNRLPARCNWLINKALPKWDESRDCYVEPYRPFEPIGVIHLVGRKKQRQPHPEAVELETVAGRRVKKTLRFEPSGAAVSRPIAAKREGPNAEPRADMLSPPTSHRSDTAVPPRR